MKEPVKILEQINLESELNRIKEILISAKQNFEEANLLFHQFLESDPAVKDRYRIYAESRDQTTGFTEDPAHLTKAEEEIIRESDYKGPVQKAEKDEAEKDVKSMRDRH